MTDLHIAPLHSPTIMDIDVWGQFRRVLAEAKSYKPDLLVISGDLCYQSGDAAIYRWIKRELEQSAMDFLVIAGNHDDSKLMASIFGLPANLSTEECYYSKQYPVGKILFLDSGKAAFSETQWAWLDAELSSNLPMIIFMHHPPLLAQMPFMDTHYPFNEIKRLQQVLAQKGTITPVFCGHYHAECTIRHKQLTAFITPSTMAQIDGNNPEYALDHLTPGFRIIDWNGRQVITSAKYLFD